MGPQLCIHDTHIVQKVCMFFERFMPTPLLPKSNPGVASYSIITCNKSTLLTRYVSSFGGFFPPFMVKLSKTNNNL